MKLQSGLAPLAVALLLAAPAFAQDVGAAAPPASSASPASSAPAAPAPSSAPAAPAVTAPPDAAPSSGPVVADTGDALPAGKGRVIFYRNSPIGVLIGCAVHENDATLSSLPYGKYFVRDFDPGIHTFMVESESKQTLRIEVEAGETYYVKCAIGMGLIVGRPNLSPSDKASFDKASNKLKLQSPPKPKAA